MVRKIGNAFIFFIWVILFLDISGKTVPITVEIQLLNEQGTVVSKTGVGMPTLLEISVRGASAPVEKFFIEGIQNFAVEQRGTAKQVSTVNGVTTTKTTYRYMIRSQKEGNYTIGPVQIQSGGKSYLSSTKPLEVLRNYTDSSSRETVVFESFLDKERVVIGETVPLHIRFYSNDRSELIGFEEFKIENSTLSEPQGPFSGSTQKNGVEKKYIEWRFLLVPKVTGEIVIPSLRAHYKESQNSYNGLRDFFGGMSAMFDIGYDKKSISTPALYLKVDPLPAYDKPSHAVGSFSSFTAKSNQQTAKVGEGIVYSLEIVGDANLNALEHPALNLPESLTYYTSKSFLDASGTKKTFEYIVQGKQEGNIQIPTQEFVFFDSNERTYKTLMTESISLTITPGSRSVHAPAPTQTTDNGVLQNSHAIWPVNETFYDNTVSKDGIPWYLFWIIFLLPLMFSCGIRIWRWYMRTHADAFSKKRAYRDAQKKLKMAAKKHDTAALYDIFIIFIAEYCGATPGEVSAEFIQQKIARFSQDTGKQWDIFFAHITQEAYASGHLSLPEKEVLFKNAQRWLTLFGTLK